MAELPPAAGAAGLWTERSQLDDLGNISTDPNLTHMGIRNPADYPVVRGRPPGSVR